MNVTGRLESVGMMILTLGGLLLSVGIFILFAYYIYNCFLRKSSFK